MSEHMLVCVCVFVCTFTRNGQPQRQQQQHRQQAADSQAANNLNFSVVHAQTVERVIYCFIAYTIWMCAFTMQHIIGVYAHIWHSDRATSTRRAVSFDTWNIHKHVHIYAHAKTRRWGCWKCSALAVACAHTRVRCWREILITNTRRLAASWIAEKCAKIVWSQCTVDVRSTGWEILGFFQIHKFKRGFRLSLVLPDPKFPVHIIC